MARTTRVALWKCRLASKENLPLGPVSDGHFPRASRRELAATRGKVAAILEHWEHPPALTPSASGTSAVGLKLQRANAIGDEEEKDTANLCLVAPTQNDIIPSAIGPSGSSVVQATQKLLAQKHYEAKSNLEGVSGVGGGVSIWPAMDDMRLSRQDAFLLAKVCLGLVIATIAIFWWFHGKEDSYQLCRGSGKSLKNINACSFGPLITLK